MAVLTYDMTELEQPSGVSARTVRSWMRDHLLPRGQGRGRAASYDDRHLRRLRVIQHLRAQDMKLPAIRARMRGLTEAQLDEIIMQGAVPAAPAAPARASCRARVPVDRLRNRAPDGRTHAHRGSEQG